MLVLVGLQAYVLRELPYSRAWIENVSPQAVASDLKQHADPREPQVGSLSWQNREYRESKTLEDYRELFDKCCPGKAGLEAAKCISDYMAERISFGTPPTEFLYGAYDPAHALHEHLSGTPTHCVNLSGLLATTLLSAGIPARVVQLVPPAGDTGGHTVIEVYDRELGWVLFDPAYGGMVEIDGSPASAQAALASPRRVRWRQLGLANYDTDPRLTYETDNFPLRHGALMYPEPWLYTRVGTRASVFPFSARFVRVGPFSWRFGPLQKLLYAGISICLGIAAITLAFITRRFWRIRKRNQAVDVNDERVQAAALYICYQSLLEPLTQTQVVAYLEGLGTARSEDGNAEQDSRRILLLTFEPRKLSKDEEREWRGRMAEKGIAWCWLRYHKRPSVPATLWDVLAGIRLGRRLVRRHNVTIIHARGHVPGLMARVLKTLTGARFLFDVRGFMAEEYADAGVWKEGGWLFRVTKRVERALVRSADGIVVLTQSAKALLHDWYPAEMAQKPVEVIPCCVNLRPLAGSDGAENGLPAEGDKPLSLRFVYVGKLGGWYLTREMTEFVATALHILPDLHWQIWSQSDRTDMDRMLASHDFNGHAATGQLLPEQLPAALQVADAGLSFIKPSLSKQASSPTKVGEYLAAGLPVVANAGVGDVDRLLAGGDEGPVGVLVREFTKSAYRQALQELIELLGAPGIRQRCRSVARQHLDLETVGWVRYRKLYDILEQDGSA